MDSPAVARLFRQLFRHPACQPRRNFAQLVSSLQHARRPLPDRRLRPSSARAYAAPPPRRSRASDSDWQQRTDLFPADMSAEYAEYPVVTADELRQRRERPRRVKMLMRDFIEDSLYNPHYGYFAKQVVIFSPGEPFDFGGFRDEPAFQRELSARYTAFEDRLDAEAVAAGGTASDTRQLWYTPTELFRPHYGEAVARYLAANYKLTHFPYHDLLVYEAGAGRGTLMTNILDYLRAAEPAVYARTRYRIIEISAALAALQKKAAAAAGHADHVEVVHQSLFDWSAREPAPCFFLAFEVFDNLAHDCLRYDLATRQPLQAVVLVAANGEFYPFYEPRLDPVAARFLRVRHAATAGHYRRPYPRSGPAGWPARLLAGLHPFAPNLSPPEYLPTRLLDFFGVLARSFPAHRLLTSDFHALPDAIPGLNAPVVQTRYKRRPVPVSTPLVHQGYFDIMFPTDFAVVEALYRAVTGKLSRVVSHRDFMRHWASIEDTETLSGENPLLSWYKNASVLATV